MRDDEGHAHAINLGFAHATGDVMAFLNSDDLLLPGSLHYVARYFERHPDVDVVYGHRVLVDKNDMEIGRWVMPRHDDEVLSWADFVPQETLFWRRRIWERGRRLHGREFRSRSTGTCCSGFREAGAKTVACRASWAPSGSTRRRRPRRSWTRRARRSRRACASGSAAAR